MAWRSTLAPSSAPSPAKKNRAERPLVQAGTAAETLLAAYEDLRRLAIESSPHGVVAVGLALLRRSGLAAWVESFAALSTSLETSPTPAASVPGRLPSADLRGELTMVVAAMALSAVPQGGAIRA